MGRGLWLALVAASACGDEGVLIRVSAEAEASWELDALCLSVADSNPEGGEFSRRYELEERGLPQSLAVEPGRATEAVTRARGYIAGLEVARGREVLSFPGASEVEVPLAACAPGELRAPEVREAAGVRADALALSRGARRDLLVALGPEEAAILARTESGLEETDAAAPSPPSEPRAAVAADVGANCEDDVIVASDRGIELWERSGAELAEVEAGFSDAPGTFVALAAGDLDRDGTPDIVAGGGDALEIYWNEGEGQFRRDPDAIPAGVASDVSSIAVADVLGDGALDILVGQGQEEPAPLVLLVPDPDDSEAFAVAGGATPEVAYETRRVSATAAPGAPADAFAATAGGIVHLVNRGDGRLEDRSGATFAGASDIDARDVSAGDWDGDCRPDALIAPAQGDIQAWSAEGDGSFSNEGGIGEAGGTLILDDLGGLARRDLVIAEGDRVLWITR